MAGRQRTRAGPRPAAVGYLRRSTDRQEQSIPDQRRAVERHCDERGLALLRCYTDDAVSGTSTAGRKAFQRMMEDAQGDGRDFTTVVVYDVKRFGRVDNDEAGYYRHLLRQRGVEVLYVTENFNGDGTDDLLRPVKQWQAREESKDLSRVTIRGLLSKSATGHWMGGAPPYGYDLRYESSAGEFLFTLRYLADGSKRMLDERGAVTRALERGATIAVSRRDHCRLTPGEPARVAVVREVFAMYVDEGMGYKAIADRLNARGVAPARGPAWSGRYSGLWSMTTVRAILTNPAYRGDVVWNRRTDARFHRIAGGRAVCRNGSGSGGGVASGGGRRLEHNDKADWIVARDAHEPLIDRALWDAAQRCLHNKPASAIQRGATQRLNAPTPTVAAMIGTNSAAKSITTSGVTSGGGGGGGPRAKFLLSGLCACARCGSRYEGYTQRSRRRDDDGARLKRYTYACGGAIRRGKATCALGEVPRDALEAGVVGALLAFYAHYVGRAGAARLRAAAHDGLDLRRREQRALGESTRRRVERVEGLMRRLVDNISPGNRAVVDRRLRELEAERDALRAELDALERNTVSARELRRSAEELSNFVARLPETLDADTPLDARRDALRRCVHAIVIDRAANEARVEAYAAPTRERRGGATERLTVPLPPR